MTTKIKIWSVNTEGAVPKKVSPMMCNEGASYGDFRVQLESHEVVAWPFNFWDLEEGCRIGVKFERLNTVQEDVYLIPVEDDGDEPSKRRRVGDDAHVFDSGHDNILDDIDLENRVEEPNIISANSSTIASCSKMGGLGANEENLEPLKSKLISKEVMEMYLKGEEKLRKELQLISLEDHEWTLKSWDKDNEAIVILHCCECDKDFGSKTGLHSKDRVTNIFSNFKKSHIMSVQHIRNWCRRKGVDWCHHPQSVARGKPVILTAADHRRVIQEGVDIFENVNANVEDNNKPFLLIGDPEADSPRCFWFKIKCVYCNDFFQLCPPKKNLEANLRNHLGGTKHEKAVHDSRSAGKALLSGRRGRPSQSSRNSVHSNQRDLHSWFSGATNSIEAGECLSWDRSNLLRYMCWGFRGPTCNYAGKIFQVESLLNDPHPGQSWYCEPHLHGTIVVGGVCVKVAGTFRHRDCLRFSPMQEPWAELTCPNCARIPLEAEFRMRVVREDRSLHKRGSRSARSGIRIGYLSQYELSSHYRVLSKRLKHERLYHWAAKVRLAQLRVTRPTLRQSAKSASTEHNLVKFCTDVISAHRTGAFGGKPALWDFMRDVAANLNRKKQGFRFSRNSKCFAQTMKMYGGRRMCDFFSLNYAGPSYSTVKRDAKKGVHFVPGEHAAIFQAIASIYKDAKEAHGIFGPVPIILAEDETKVKARIAYEQKWDTLAGFCGRSSDHVCISVYKPIVGMGESGYTNILESFRNDKIGGFARVVVVNPLHECLPRLVLVVCCTCNCFDSGWVRRQWGLIDQLWEQECKEIVGPIVGHSSDGDSRRRQLMLEDYRSSEGTRLKVDWAGWLLTARLGPTGEASGLHDQDFVHNGKKLVNPLDSPVRVLQLGGDMYALEHLGLIYSKYTYDKHGLKLEDVQRSDRQNWASAQRICQPKTRHCLALLRAAPEVHQERTLGTEMYLQICGDYIDIFLSPRHDLRSRLVLAAKVSFFFRLWRLWFKYGNHAVHGNSKKPTLQENFVSQQCFVDVQLSCHFVVLLICHFRDRYSHLPVPLHLTGSDACEIFFSKIGGMVGLERAYDFHELVNTANTVNNLAGLEYQDNGLEFGRIHNKMENVWESLEPLVGSEVRCNLGDYSQISTDDMVVSALKEGFKEAQKLLRILNMAPSCTTTWFHTPWVLEKANPKHLAFVAGKRLVAGEDGDSEVLREILRKTEVNAVEEMSIENLVPNLEEEIVNDDMSDPLPFLENETRDALSEVMFEMEEHVGGETLNLEKVLPYVVYEGNHIYKSTLVSQLNSNPFLSKDRLIRVKNSIYFNNSEAYLAAASSSSSMLLGLGSDAGVYFLQRNTTTVSSTVKAALKRTRGRPSKNSAPTCVLNGVDEGTWWVGRVQKIRRKVGTRWGTSRQPIDLQNRQVNSGNKNFASPSFMVFMQWFRKVPGQFKFKYDHADCKWIDVDTIISTVTMSYNPTQKLYSLDLDDATSLNDFVSTRN